MTVDRLSSKLISNVHLGGICMKRLVFVFGIVLTFAIGASAQGLAVGAPMENFSIADISGKTQSLSQLKGKNGAVVIFLSAQCPVVRMYNERINQIAKDYAAKGINFIGINSNVSESPDAVKTHAELNYEFPMLMDKGSVLANKLNANVTPEVFFIDAKGNLFYTGRIDNDRYAKNISESNLKEAIEASLAGRKIEKTSVAAFGCSIKRSTD